MYWKPRDRSAVDRLLPSRDLLGTGEERVQVVAGAEPQSFESNLQDGSARSIEGGADRVRGQLGVAS